MPRNVTIWHGTDEALSALKIAVERNCECRVSAVEDPTPPTCPAHQLLTDQAVLDHLAFVISRREAYWHAEFDQIREWF